MKATGRGSKTGLSVERRFTAENEDAYSGVEWSTRTSRITNPDGTVVFEMADAEVPADWSQVASDIMVSKYFRKAGVPQFDASGNPILDESGKPVLGPERSARQVIGRLTGGWRHWGESNGYFATASDAKAFEDELAYMLVHQMAAPNSPQWFNTGLGLGLWDHRTRAGPLLRRSRRRTGQSQRRCLHTPATPRLLHPERERLAGRTGRPDGPLGARSADLQVRIRYGNEFLGRAW